MNFPNLFRRDILVGMKPLNLMTLSFTVEKDNYEDNYFQLGKDRKCFDEYFNFEKEKSINIQFTCCLINFEENLFVLHNKLIENKAEKLLYYKNISNDFYKKGMIHKSKKINKKIADIYIKYVNLDNRNHIAYNDQVFKEIEDVTTTKSYNKEIDDVIRKIMSNLVIFLYKMGRKDQCLKYINEFLKLYLKDEKVEYYQYLIYYERGEYEMSKKILENLIKYNSNEKMYKDNLLKIEEKIGKNKEQQLNYMKKMIKANQS
jgi:tetratricopeptide (TPR) repeat protein